MKPVIIEGDGLGQMEITRAGHVFVIRCPWCEASLTYPVVAEDDALRPLTHDDECPWLAAYENQSCVG